DLREPAAIVAVAGGLDPNDLGQSIERTERECHWSVRRHAGDRAGKGRPQGCSRLDSTTRNTAMTRCQRPDDEPEHAEITRELRLLVTGGAGFIGSNFIRFWFVGHPDDEIINVDLLTYAGDPANNADVARARGDRYSFVQADICDGRAIKEIVAEHPPDVIVNFAAESHNSRGVLEPAAFVRTNALGTQTLLEVAHARRVPLFHHISTCEVYGDLALDSVEAFTEESPYRPRTPYNASKAAAELIVHAYHETFGLATTVTNCSNNYGPWQHPEKVIALFTTGGTLWTIRKSPRSWAGGRPSPSSRAYARPSAGTRTIGRGGSRRRERCASRSMSSPGSGQPPRLGCDERRHSRRRVGVPSLSVDPPLEQAPIGRLLPAHGLLLDPTPRRMRNRPDPHPHR